MKYNILGILLCIFQGVNAQTLTLDSFYSPGSRWVEYTFYVYGLGQSKTEGKAYWSDHDSVMNGKNYHLIYSNMLGGFSTVAVVTGTETDYFTDSTSFGMIGGVRVEGSRVYFYRTGDSAAFINITGLPVDSESLVYDYSLVPGDSVAWQTYNSSWGLYNVVRDTGTQYLTAGYSGHQIIFDTTFVSTPSKNYWVTGIGSSFGFLGTHANNTVWGFMATHSLCYTHGTFQYKFPNYLPLSLADNCFDMSLLDSRIPVANADEIILYPNPLTADQLCAAGNGLHNVSRLTITDITGRAVFDAFWPFLGQNKVETHLPDAGMYFVTIQFGEHEKVIRKLVKQ